MSPKACWLTLLLTVAPLQAQYSGTVSLRQLRTRIAPKVERLVSASSEALANGNLERGIAYLEAAVRADSGSAALQHDLGVLYLQNGSPEKARSAFAKSLEAEPDWAVALTGMSLSLYCLGDTTAAESAARRAMHAEPSRRQAQMALGMALVAQGKYDGEALSHLRSAAVEFPEARMFAADVLLHQGSIDHARDEILSYLKSGQTELRAMAEQWLRIVTLE